MKKNPIGSEWWLWWRDRSLRRPARRFKAPVSYVDDDGTTWALERQLLELALRREGYDSAGGRGIGDGPFPLRAFRLQLRDRRKGRTWMPAEVTPPLYRVASSGKGDGLNDGRGRGLFLWVSPEVLHATGKIFEGPMSPAIGWRVLVDLASPESLISAEARVAIDHLLETGRVLAGVEGAQVDTTRA